MKDTWNWGILIRSQHFIYYWGLIDYWLNIWKSRIRWSRRDFKRLNYTVKERNYNMPGFPVSHHLPEFAQVHVHWNGDVTQPYHPLLPSSPSWEKAVVTYKETLSSINLGRIFFWSKGTGTTYTKRWKEKKNLQLRLLYPGNPYCNHSVMSLHTCHNGYHEKDNIKCCQRCGEKGIFVHCWWDCKLAELLWKRMWNFV